ncbi:MAG: tRNA (adenosine(37)-N6)-dimethylallyltransferase MiaA [Gammaproteobacteria bacterium]|nr:tRNA (adenosine(37)-N6)-dimethylallyltransferase MiaA [Gammaproteobacteria bacterium]
MGPTAAGKTVLAMELARTFQCTLISVDSAQVYRHMDVGTGKPTVAERTVVPHHLVDIREPHCTYSAAAFAADAREVAHAAWAAGHIPLLVGGTGLYFRALLSGLSALPSACPGLREELESEAAHIGWSGLHRRLAELDPATAARLHPNDAQRIQRALEVCLTLRKPMSEYLAGAVPSPLLALGGRLLKLVVSPADRTVLHRRIALRFDRMLTDGLVGEVQSLRVQPRIHRHLPAMKSIGYRQTWDYLEGEITRHQLSEQVKAATRQLARRQLTWLRRETQVHWLDSTDGALVGRASKLIGEALRGSAKP